MLMQLDDFLSAATTPPLMTCLLSVAGLRQTYLAIIAYIKSVLGGCY